MARAMILAAGLGTRLRPLTDELPKPLVPLGDTTPLGFIAARLVRAGFNRVVVNTHHLASVFTPSVLRRVPALVSLQHEPEILGTGGGVALACRSNALTDRDDGGLVIWNGDILVDLDLRSLARAHARASARNARNDGAIATLAVAFRPLGEGTVGLDADGDVVRLRGERFGLEALGGDFVGVQMVSADFAKRLPEVGCLVGDGYLPALRSGARIAASEAPSAWDDIGTVASYLRANLHWLEGAGLTSFEAPTANVAESVELASSVVGEGAEIGGAGRLDRCVVWPGAHVEAPLSNAVVTQHGVVRVGLGDEAARGS